MKKSLTIATFISKNENFNNDLDKLINYLSDEYEIETYIFSDKKELIKDNYFLKVNNGQTKYARILELLNCSKNNDILCIDNDIITEKENIKTFLKNSLNIDYSISWGKIKAHNPNNFVSNLVEIDKNLTHDIIRPISWKLKFGISLPGQVFLINKNYFANKLLSNDTVYDDLAIGLIVRHYNMPVYFTDLILGYEEPKRTVKSLVRQRKRWAQGLAEIIHISANMSSQKYVLIHGLIYNLLWLPIDIILIISLLYSKILFLVLFLFIILSLSSKKIKNIFWAFVYILLFWIIYVIWFFEFIKNLKKLKN